MASGCWGSPRRIRCKVARDYKSRAASSAPKSAPGWVWFLGGVLTGLFVAGLVYLRENRDPSELGQVATANPRPATRAAEKPDQTKPDTPKPRFDFYNLLPEMEVVVPDPEPEPVAKARKPTRVPDKAPARAVAAAKPRAPVTRSGDSYLLQVGSFRKRSEADRLRARLALLGVEARIQRVSIDGRDAWHRVRVGPFSDLGKANDVRARLKANQIAAIVMKLKG